jgi:hypothetical protein
MSMSVELAVSILKNADCVISVTLREKRTEFRGENVLEAFTCKTGKKWKGNLMIDFRNVTSEDVRWTGPR